MYTVKINKERTIKLPARIPVKTLILRKNLSLLRAYGKSIKKTENS